MPSTLGVVEHQVKLAAVIKAARKQKCCLAIAWLDIANAYGSVHHSLIQFSFAHYHAPLEFCHLLHSWYTGLSGIISTDLWSTDPVPLKTGLYQGDPLSVIIFLIVMSSLSALGKILGFHFYKHLSNSTIFFICIVSSTPAGCQHLLDMIKRWLDWAQLRAKVATQVSLHGHSGIVWEASEPNSHHQLWYDPSSRRRNVQVPFLECLSERTPAMSKQELLSSDLYSKCWMLPHCLVARSSGCSNMVCILAMASADGKIPNHMTRAGSSTSSHQALKSWFGLARHANKKGRLGLPSLVGEHKKLQALKMV